MKNTILVFTALIAFISITAKVNAQQNILQYIKVYFTQPIDSTFANGVKASYLNDVVFDTLAAYINRAKYTIDISQYEYKTYTGDPIYVAINNAFLRGVKVRYIQDGGYAPTNTGVALLDTLIPVIASPTTSAYGICHNKFVIIDEYAADSTKSVVWTGSPDWDADMSKGDYNNVIIFQSKVLAKAYTHEFDIMWGDTTHGGPSVPATSKFGKYKPNSGTHLFNIGGSEVELYFSPSDSVNRAIINTITTANVDLYCGMFTFTKVTDANDIVNQKNSGAFAAAILDHFSSGGYTPYSTIFPTNLGSNFVGYSSGTYLYHNKYLIVNPSAPCYDPKVLTGSHNWTASADTKNDENTVIVHNDTIANLYLQSFAGDFKAIGGSSLTRVPNPLDTTKLFQTICENDNYNYYGTYLNTAGTYFHTIVSYHGCDSIVRLALSVNPVDTTPQSQAICQGGSYNFYGTFLTTANTYYHTLVSSLSCDSVIKLSLSVNPADTTIQSQTICQGGSYNFYGTFLTTANNYYHTLTSSLSCDSIIKLALIVNPIDTMLQSQAVCQDSSYNFYGTYLTSANTYYHTLVSSLGCDSVIKLSLSIYPAPATPVITQAGPYLISDATSGNQWYDDYGIITGATAQVYIPAITSNYYCIVTDTDGCVSDTSIIIYIVITGLTDFSDYKNIDVYPDPATENVAVSCFRFTVYDLKIYDVVGNLILEKNFVNNKTNIDHVGWSSYVLDVSTFAKGMYYIKINTENGVAVKKFIKE